jgi:hypothetical protein
MGYSGKPQVAFSLANSAAVAAAIIFCLRIELCRVVVVAAALINDSIDLTYELDCHFGIEFLLHKIHLPRFL